MISVYPGDVTERSANALEPGPDDRGADQGTQDGTGDLERGGYPGGMRVVCAFCGTLGVFARQGTRHTVHLSIIIIVIAITDRSAKLLSPS